MDAMSSLLGGHQGIGARIAHEFRANSRSVQMHVSVEARAGQSAHFDVDTLGQVGTACGTKLTARRTGHLGAESSPVETRDNILAVGDANQPTQRELVDRRCALVKRLDAEPIE